MEIHTSKVNSFQKINLFFTLKIPRHLIKKKIFSFKKNLCIASEKIYQNKILVIEQTHDDL